MDDARQEMSLEIEEMKRFLDIADVREFIYDIDKDELVNLRYGKKREVFYRGPLEAWAEGYIKRQDGKVNEKFGDFYHALKDGVPSFQQHYEYKGLYRSAKFVTEEKPEGGKVIYGVIMTGKVSEHEDIRYQRASDKDAMLDMLNKKAIVEYAKRTLEKDNCPTTYLIIFDLDHFKLINDTYGHLFGDEVLVTVSGIINKVIGEHGVVGRIGGDEILIVTKGIHDKAELRPMLKELRMAVEEAYQGKTAGFSLTCSMGTAAYPDHGSSYMEVMDIADKMLYLAKEKGRNRYIIYTPELHKKLITAKNSGTAPVMGFPAAFDNIGIMQYMLDNYLRKDASTNDTAFASIGKSFQLSEILIVYDKGRNGFRWTPEGVGYGEKDLTWLSMDEKLTSLFDKNHLLVIDGLYNLTDDQKFLLEPLTQRGVESAIFYQMLDKGVTEGYVMFAKKIQRQRWAEYELLALSTIAKIFEISIYH